MITAGNADIWLAKVGCKNCTGTNGYDPALSSSYSPQRAGLIGIGDGNISGTVASETVSFGGFILTSQTLRRLSLK